MAIELSKQLTFSKTHVSLYHYRTSSNQEIDFILEGPQNHIVGIKVKSTSKVSDRDFKNLQALKVDLGEKFRRGFVIYSGNDVVPFSEDMWAIPITVLWQ